MYYIELRDKINLAVYKHFQANSTFTTVQIQNESGAKFQTVSHRFDNWLVLGIIKKVDSDRTRQARPAHIHRLDIEKFEEYIGRVIEA